MVREGPLPQPCAAFHSHRARSRHPPTDHAGRARDNGWAAIERATQGLATAVRADAEVLGRISGLTATMSHLPGETSPNRSACRGDLSRAIFEMITKWGGGGFCAGRRCLLSLCRGSPAQRAAPIRHAGIQWHDVQVVCVGGEDVRDQIRRARGWHLRVDRRLAMESGITRRQRFGRDGP